MNLKKWCLLMTGLMSFSALPVVADEARVLDMTDESVTSKAVRYSMMGPRDTLLFYTFPNQQAILVVNVDNKSTKFPVSAVVHVFPKETKAEDLAKWINNQHSDGLYPEIPTPTGSYPLPEESCSKVSSKKMTQVETRGPKGKAVFDNHVVEYKIADFAKEGVVSLKGFTSTTQVLVKVD